MKKNNKKGFTLVELVIVVAVMAVLVAVAIPTVGSITNKAKTAVNDSNARTIESVLKLAEANASAAAAADGVAKLDEAAVAKAVAEAKLGIEKDAKFAYNPNTGAVAVGDATGDAMQITFAENGGVKVSKGSTTKTATVGADGTVTVS